jgi:diketogulonate reductase-like aldo/keto reductase
MLAFHFNVYAAKESAMSIGPLSIPRLNANGASIPFIGFGTGGLLGQIATSSVESAIRTGYRHIDTARKYGNETAVGAGIRASGVARSELFITTKVSHENLHTADFNRSLDESLSALGLDQIDLLLVHWPNPAIPLVETLTALAAAKRRGLARHVGVANFTTALLAQAIAICDEPLACNQVEFHPYLDQSKLQAVARQHGLSIIGYCPFMRGGEVLTDPVIRAIADAHDRTPAQTILRWITQNDGVGAIPRSTNPERIRQNLDVFGFRLDPGEMARIDALRTKNKRRANPPHAPIWDAA